MNIIEKTDEEILELAHPMWADLIKYSNEQNYGAFTRNFAAAMMLGANEIEMGKQFARSDLTKNLSEDYEYLGIIRPKHHCCREISCESTVVLFIRVFNKISPHWVRQL